MRIDLVTLFPEYFAGPLSSSLIKRARSAGKVEFHLNNPRDFTCDRHRTVDHRPFGGGAGMVLKPEPIFKCVQSISGKGFVILLSPRGKPLTADLSRQLSRKKHLVLICGHYEGIDERVHKHLADMEVSVGDFVTMGGEAPALCLIESVLRFVPGVLGNRNSLASESFSKIKNGVSGRLLEFPQYTRPRVFRGWAVPEVLLSGNHQAIEAWRKNQSILLTKKNRPDLLEEKKERKTRHGSS